MEFLRAEPPGEQEGGWAASAGPCASVDAPSIFSSDFGFGAHRVGAKLIELRQLHLRRSFSRPISPGTGFW